MSDAVLSRIKGGKFDFTIASNGDILQADFLDTAILVSIYENKRASQSEVQLPQNREGWIGNESTPDFERGSKIWLYEQAKLTQEVINAIESAANESLAWLITDGLAVSVTSDVRPKNGLVILKITIERPQSIVLQKELFLWENSGVTRIAA